MGGFIFECFVSNLWCLNSFVYTKALKTKAFLSTTCIYVQRPITKKRVYYGWNNWYKFWILIWLYNLKNVNSSNYGKNENQQHRTYPNHYSISGSHSGQNREISVKWTAEKNLFRKTQITPNNEGAWLSASRWNYQYQIHLKMMKLLNPCKNWFKNIYFTNRASLRQEHNCNECRVQYFVITSQQRKNKGEHFKTKL